MENIAIFKRIYREMDRHAEPVVEEIKVEKI